MKHKKSWDGVGEFLDYPSSLEMEGLVFASGNPLELTGERMQSSKASRMRRRTVRVHECCELGRESSTPCAKRVSV